MLPLPPSQGGGLADRRSVGRQFGRIAAVSQLFSVLLFPQLFSTLHCAFRTRPLVRAGEPDRSHPPLTSTPPRCEGELRTATYGELFVIIAFANERTNERSGNGVGSAGRKNPSPPLSVSFSLSLSSSASSAGSSHERVAALVRLRSGFFPLSLWSIDCCIIYAGAVITA